MGRSPCIGLGLLSFASQLDTVGAWSPAGHDRIGRIAEHLLVGKHKDQIRTMMHSGLPDMADYEATMTRQYPLTSTLHWHHQAAPEWTCSQKGGLGDTSGHLRCDGHGPTQGSLFCALAFFFEHFAHDALLKEFPAPAEPIGTPETLPALQHVPEANQGPAHFLKWLVILVGDMHQPLHWLPEHDFGKHIDIRYEDQTYSLLDFWEDYLPKHLKHKLETGIQPFEMDKDYGQHSKAWAHKSPTELFRDWAKEVAARVCGEVYAPMTVNHADGTRVENPFTLTDELFQKWVKLAEELLQLAGERLGFVLNEIIEHKRHKEAQKDGRALPSRKVAVQVENKAAEDPKGDKAREAVAEAKDPNSRTPVEAERRVPMPMMTGGKPDIALWYKTLKVEERHRNRTSALYNIVVACILVPLLLFGFSWHLSIGGGNLFSLAKVSIH